MSASHLRCRKGTYYVRIRVPQDVKHLIQRDELNQSLKTSDKRIATLLARDYLYQINRKFMLLRTGYLDDPKTSVEATKLFNDAYPSSTAPTADVLAEGVADEVAEAA